MSMIKHTTTGPPSTSTRRSHFLGCFGCFGEKTWPKDEVNSGSRRRCWSSKWRLFKKPPKKTVPVDLTTVPATSETSWDEIQVVEENANSINKHATSGEQKASRRKWTTAVNRQKETKPAATSATLPGLITQEQKTVTMARPLVSHPLKPLTQSKSIPSSKQQKHADASATGGRVNSGVLHRTPPSKEFDSIIGMSIILVILVILVLWGKLCAILCTSAWFFVAPRLVAVGKRSAADKQRRESGKNLDLESEEYKKKVVLEGLLQRNHRKALGR
ncbi:hypothetical protein HanRHA438_Chr17g0799901 [Helianthus annuus]|nr:hypothetical protein HanHA89_Chr17g0695211 [Helianthus annuus]KAJ0825141.1 hypothetical protein HanRHA438_Chr17g0799901 [Helianthus annuus]